MYLIAQKFPELAEFKPISKRIDIEFINNQTQQHLQVSKTFWSVQKCKTMAICRS